MSAARRVMADGPIAGGLAYSVDGQGLVLRVREASHLVTATRREDRAQPSPQALVSPLTWEPLQRLLAWGAREGMTAAELLDSCRAATHQTTMTTRRRRSAR
jgi:hypothetical protein